MVQLSDRAMFHCSVSPGGEIANAYACSTVDRQFITLTSLEALRMRPAINSICARHDNLYAYVIGGAFLHRLAQWMKFPCVPASKSFADVKIILRSS